MDPSLIIPSRVQDWEGVTAPAGANGRCNNLAEGNSNSIARQLNNILLPRRTTLSFFLCDQSFKTVGGIYTFALNYFVIVAFLDPLYQNSISNSKISSCQNKIRFPTCLSLYE